MQQTMKVISDTNIIDSARLNARLFFTPTCCNVVLTTSVAPSITPKYVPRNDFDIATTATIIPEIDNHAGAFGSIESADKMVTPSSLAASIYEGGIESRQLKTKNNTLMQMMR